MAFGDESINSLLKDNIMNLSIFKSFTDGMLILTQTYVIEIVSERAKNNMGKGENAGYHHFLLFQQCFEQPSLSGSLKLYIIW